MPVVRELESRISSALQRSGVLNHTGTRLANPTIDAQNDSESLPRLAESNPMKIIVSVLAVVWLVSGCASLTTAPDDDSVTGANLDTRTNLCTDATPPPCNPPRD